MKDRILTPIKRATKSIQVRRRRGDSLITKAKATRPGRVFQ
jgi:hypothetical protein